jgi:hypothetical protein
VAALQYSKQLSSLDFLSDSRTLLILEGGAVVPNIAGFVDFASGRK